MPWFVYIARCRDGTLYTGVSTDVPRRLAAHNAGRGAAYTRSRAPVMLGYVEPAADRGSALRREHAIKGMTRGEKMGLVGKPGRKARPAGATGFAGFPAGGLRFLRALRRHNTREWFAAHRLEYDTYVRDPMRALVEEMDVRLARIAPEMVGDPARSIFRIHRDVRFSADKSPYKTHAAAQFYHRDAGRGAGVDATGAGASFYFHFDPAESFVAGGLWMPARPALNAIRDAIAADPEGFEEIVTAPAFRRRFGALEDEAVLKRMPRGFSEDHPGARWLRYRSFIGYQALAAEDVTGARLPVILERNFLALLPLVRWLNAAVGYRPALRR
jgi:uncharacterized protein (TIGR02453 family)